MQTTIFSSFSKNYINVVNLCPSTVEKVGGVMAEPLLAPSFATCVLRGNKEGCMQLPVHQREGTIYHVNNLLFPWQLAISITFRMFPQYKLCVLSTT